MKKVFLALLFLISMVTIARFSPSSIAQVSSQRVVITSSNPPTVCTSGYLFSNPTTKKLYQGATDTSCTDVTGGGGGSGTVTSVSVTSANGVSGVVATATTTPAITLTLGAITPTTVAPSGAVSLVSGAVATPSLKWASDATSGWYRRAEGLYALGDGTTDEIEIYGPVGIRMKSDNEVQWAVNNPTSSATDTGLARSAAGVVSVTTGAGAGNGDLRARSVRGIAVAFASLPGSPVEGMMVPVTDSNTVVWGANVAGGGSNHILAYYNGTAWTVAAK